MRAGEMRAGEMRGGEMRGIGELLSGIPWSENNSLGRVTGLREYCTVCGREFDCPGIYVPAKGRSYQTTDKCELHRGDGTAVARRESPSAPNLHMLEERWLRMCPKAFQNVDAPTLSHAVRDAITSYEYGPKGIFFHGATGTHKSRGSHLLMERLFYSGKRVKLFHPGEFFEQWLSSFGGDNNTGRHAVWMDNLVTADAVLFDDLGQEKYSDKCGAAFFSLVDRRLANNRPTFYNTNFSSEQLVQVLPAENGQQLIRRMLDGCTFVRTGKTEAFKQLEF